MRFALRFLSGLGAALVCAASVLVVLVVGYALVSAGVAAGGDGQRFEADIRHYTDTLRVDETGSIRIDQAAHPILQMVATGVGAAVMAVASGWALRRLTLNRTQEAVTQPS